MPKFMDSHPLKGTIPETLKNLQKTPIDEFGVTHLNLIYREHEDRCYCLLEAPSKADVEKHHHKLGLDCDFILEVNSTAESDD